MLRDQDIFSHNFKLNFNRRGDVHPTPVGGFVSLILKIFYFLYMMYLVNKMLTYDDDRTYEYDFQIPLDNLDQKINTKSFGFT